MSLRKCIIFTCKDMLQRCLLPETAANHIARSRGTLVPHIVPISYPITLLAIVHMYQECQERYNLYTLCLQ